MEKINGGNAYGPGGAERSGKESECVYDGMLTITVARIQRIDGTRRGLLLRPYNRPCRPTCHFAYNNPLLHFNRA